MLWDGEKSTININDKRSFYSGMDYYVMEESILYGIDLFGVKVKIDIFAIENLEGLKSDIKQYGEPVDNIHIMGVYKENLVLFIPYKSRTEDNDGGLAIYQYNLKHDTFRFIDTVGAAMHWKFHLAENNMLYSSSGHMLVYNFDTRKRYYLEGKSWATIGGDYLYFINVDDVSGKNILYKQKLGEQSINKVIELPIRGDLKFIGDWIYCVDAIGKPVPIVYKVKIDGTRLAQSTPEEIGWSE